MCCRRCIHHFSTYEIKKAFFFHQCMKKCEINGFKEYCEELDNFVQSKCNCIFRKILDMYEKIKNLKVLKKTRHPNLSHHTLDFRTSGTLGVEVHHDHCAFLRQRSPELLGPVASGAVVPDRRRQHRLHHHHEGLEAPPQQRRSSSSTVVQSSCAHGWTYSLQTSVTE